MLFYEKSKHLFGILKMRVNSSTETLCLNIWQIQNFIIELNYPYRLFVGILVSCKLITWWLGEISDYRYYLVYLLLRGRY
jgi:hypothetical protein